MSAVTTAGNTAWRLYDVDGVPSSGPRHPTKAEILAFVALVGAGLSVREVTAAGAIVLTNADFLLIVNKTVGAATAVTLPAAPGASQRIKVLDGKGDAGTNNITVTGDAITGGGGTGASMVIDGNGGSLSFVRSADNTKWFLE